MTTVPQSSSQATPSPHSSTPSNFIYSIVLVVCECHKYCIVTSLKRHLIVLMLELFYLGMARPCAIIPLSLRCLSSLSRVSRISLSTALSGSSSGLRYNESSRPESSELGDKVEERGGSLGSDGWISL